MSAVPLPLPQSAQRTEDVLRLLTDMMKDQSIPRDMRERAARAHSILHPCRDPVVVREMEQRMGLV